MKKQKVLDLDYQEAPPSKTKQKQDMHDLQKLGQELAMLKQEKIKKLHLDENLLNALLQVKKIKRGEALRRQYQYIGKLMRETDASFLKLALEKTQIPTWQGIQTHHQIEVIRDNLLEENTSENTLH